jgi:hypothetical protein
MGRASKRVLTWVRTAGSLKMWLEYTEAMIMQSALNLSSLSEKWLLCNGKQLTDWNKLVRTSIDTRHFDCNGKLKSVQCALPTAVEQAGTELTVLCAYCRVCFILWGRKWLFNISVIFMFGWEVGNSCFCRGGLLRLSETERRGRGGGVNY